MRAAWIVFAVSLVGVNVFMAWSSHFLLAVAPALYNPLNHFIRSQDADIWRALLLVRYTDYTLVVGDFEVLALLFALMASTAWLSRGLGARAALLRSVQLLAFNFVIFGIELAVFDYRQFYWQVADVQISFKLARWFNNADMLLSALAVFVASSLLLGRMLPSASPEERGAGSGH